MRRFEIVFSVNEGNEETDSVFVVATNHKKAMKAFALKRPDVSADRVIEVRDDQGGKASREDLEAREFYSASSGTNMMGGGGILMLLAGLALLVFFPSMGESQVVNLQKMMVGLALTISGSVFVAAHWRPRS